MIMLLMLTLLLGCTSILSIKAQEPEPECSTVFEIATTTTGFETLVAAVVAADSPDIIALLQDAEAEYTLFAPNNAAFAKTLDVLGISAEALLALGPETIQSILLYHVVPGIAAFDFNLFDGQVLPMASGLDITVLLEGGAFLEAVGSTPQIILTNIEACNAVIHVIDEVLLPFAVPSSEPEPEPEPEPVCPATVFDIATTTPGFETLVAAVVAAESPDIIALLQDPDAVYTLFAPNNDAFAKTLDVLGLTAEELLGLGPETIQSILLYHVVPGVAAFSTDLSDGQVLPTASPDGLELIVDLEGGVFIESVGSTVQVILPDIAACGAVIHVIDEVLLPFAVDPEPPAPAPSPSPSPPLCRPRFRRCFFNFQCCSGNCRGFFFRRCSGF